MKQVSCVTAVLVLTAFTAGLVDVLSFAKLGGIFTSAMTGNLALLGFYAATGAVHSAIKSLNALMSFVMGCVLGLIQSRGKTDRSAVRRILALETLIIATCAIGSMQSSLSVRSDFVQAEIVLLAFAMGLQSIVGARLKQTNVVFTTTLIKIVSAAIGSARGEQRRRTAPRHGRRCRLPAWRIDRRCHRRDAFRSRVDDSCDRDRNCIPLCAWGRVARARAKRAEVNHGFSDAQPPAAHQVGRRKHAQYVALDRSSTRQEHFPPLAGRGDGRKNRHGAPPNNLICVRPCKHILMRRDHLVLNRSAIFVCACAADDTSVYLHRITPP